MMSLCQHFSRLSHLDKINSKHPDTFIHNTAMQGLALMRNNITDVHPSTFRNNSRLTHLEMSSTKINSIQTHFYITRNWNSLICRETV
jgi:hypothetical protein